ncbi:hypothetical protein [Dyadobacter bucti]|uniref:hypothetical protein n=1 Tax=Dyadobacter bucti TaxID=2572203 RepID=UPI003F6FD98F
MAGSPIRACQLSATSVLPGLSRTAPWVLRCNGAEQRMDACTSPKLLSFEFSAFFAGEAYINLLTISKNVQNIRQIVQAGQLQQ